ncbi:MAG: hypothetical protein ACREQY_08655, partial [Candidatus Binatia bacterium]
MNGTDSANDRWRKALAVAMGLLAVSNFSKAIVQPFDPPGNVGFVFFGTRLQGTPNLIVAPIFGLLLAAYAYGAWTGRRWT